MRSIKAIYDGKRVKLLEPISLPANTPLEVIVKEKHGRKHRQDSWDSLGDEATDPLLDLIGQAGRIGRRDVSRRHDAYLAAAKRAENR